ncbi:MAG: 6-bladed beta-propeller, partial [Candidatus Aminicenantes bacterium]
MIAGHRIVRLFQLRRTIASSHPIERSTVVIPALILVLGAVACGKTGAEWQGTIQVEDGVTTVQNPAQGIWNLRGSPGLSLVKESQIGALDGPAELTFAGIADIAVNNYGEIYIADRRLAEIRKFDKDGKYILTFGRKGQGPGEFQSIRVLSIDSNGEVIVYDDMLGRVSIFADTGELRTTTKKLLETEWIS